MNPHSNMPAHRFLGGFACALVLTTPTHAADPKPSPAVLAVAKTESMRNARYCEVITVAQSRLTFTVEVYNTIGFNDCPVEQWSALDAKALAKQNDIKFVKLNGPRFWTLDAIEGRGRSATGKTVEFGGIKMGLRATLKTKIWQGTVGDKLYTPNQVKRETIFHYKAGAEVYELVAPTGDVYVMQAYSQIIDPKLGIADLPKLGARLKLPKGWTFRVRRLATDDALKVDGVAYVINDDLYNSYQRRAR